MDEQQWVAGYRARVAEIGSRAAAASRELAAVAATASSRDGAVTVTVDAAGAPQRVVFGPAAESLARAQLAEAVLQASRQARDQAARDAVAAVTPLLGPHSAALRLLREQVPNAGMPNAGMSSARMPSAGVGPR